MGSHGPVASLRTCVVIAFILLGVAGKSVHAASYPSKIPVSNAVGKEPDFPGYLDNILRPEKAPCEAGVACGKDQWCSPSRHVCRSCDDIGMWCSDTELIHTRYPDCESYCYETLLGQAEKCRAHNQVLQNWLQQKERALNTLKEEAARREAQLQSVTGDLRRHERQEEDMHNTILALAIVSALSLLWALATSFLLWRLFLLSPSHQVICFHDKLLAEEVKCPIEVNTMDSGMFCGSR